MKQLHYFIIHCTATPEGREVTPDDIRQWHLAPRFLTPKEIDLLKIKAVDKGLLKILQSPNVLLYKGKYYPGVNALPNESIAGISVKSISGRGWSQVGYSDMILLDGSLVNLVPYDEDSYVEPWEITNGATGINGLARHIVYAGGKDRTDLSLKTNKDTRTHAQNETLKNWVFNIIAKHPTIKGAGHNQFAKKACPSFNVPQWLKSIGIADANIHHSPVFL
ncbi:MAG: lysozyme [Cyclobacteriaceae bacterium]|nr:lysozyme [Cytophagales bacterium]MCZ8327063.1 lysozyme [Cyclobacteriaceae bacterium]